MRTRLYVLWYWLRSSFWFVPTLMIVASILLSFATVKVDRYFDEHELPKQWWIYSGSVEGAREILSSIAGSMITVAGVVFSITIVVLSLASSQFGPRLIWNFMHDIGNQVVLGTFISTFMYCLLLLGRIQAVGEDVYIPRFSITLGIILGIADLGVLVYFIHHVSASIHASSVAAAVWRDLEEAIERLFPEKIGHGHSALNKAGNEMNIPKNFEEDARPVTSMGSGYLEAINPDALMRIAVERDLLMRIEYRPGHFITRGSPLALVWPGTAINEALVQEINHSFILGTQRTPEQDVEFSVHQLVEIAVRALSPGVNDPFTALTCINWLGVGLCDLAERHIPSPFRYDNQDRLRIIAPQFTFPGVMDAAFNKIRQYGCSSAAVAIRLLEVLAVIAAHVRKDEDLASVMKHAMMIRRGSLDALPEELDRDDIEERYGRVLDAAKYPTST